MRAYYLLMISSQNVLRWEQRYVCAGTQTNIQRFFINFDFVIFVFNDNLIFNDARNVQEI